MILVTGGNGYVGGWCIVELLNAGYAVRTTVRSAARAPGVRDVVGPRVPADARLEVVVADLGSSEGWAAAMDGVDGVLHVASPLGSASQLPDDEMVALARDGAVRVVQAAIDAGVARVVMTSAANAASPTSYAEGGSSDESLWTDPDAPGVIAYRRSKTLAERAAWELIERLQSATELVTVLPGAVLGPVLSADAVGSVGIIQRMLSGSMPGVPRIGLEVVDVRDLAALHVLALRSPLAAGKRYLGTGDFLWMRDIAVTLREGMGPAGAKVKTRVLPNWLVKIAARFDPGLRDILPGLGRTHVHSTARAESELGWSRRPAQETILDCGNNLVSLGLLQS